MNTYSEFEQRVINFICEKYDSLYVGKLDYTVEPDGDVFHFTLKWGLNQNDYPFVMQGQFLNEDKFFDYVCKQIEKTRFFKPHGPKAIGVEYFVAKLKGKADFYEVEGYKDPLLTFDEQTTI